MQNRWQIPSGISHEVLDCREAFRTCVVNDFIGQYQKGVTPNPCIVCNRMVKEKSLLDKAKEIGGKYIATGHYARIESIRKRDVMPSEILQLPKKTRRMRFIG